MSQQRQTQRETGESSEQTEELQRTLMENGRKAMRQFVELPLQQSLQFQRSAAELFVNGLEAQKWAQERGIELTKNTMGNYLQTLDDVTQNAEELAKTEMAAGQQQGQAIQQAMGQFQGGRRMQRQPSGGQQMGGQQPIPQQSPEMGQQTPTGGFQQPQGPQPQEIGQQQSQQPGGQQQPQPQEIRQQPRPQGMGQPHPPEIGQQRPPQIQGQQRPLGQQPSPQQPATEQSPTPQEGERQTRPDPTEASQRSSRAEGKQADGPAQKESPPETQ